MKTILALLLLTLAGCGEVSVKQYAVVLGLTEGSTCSGTMVGPGLLLTASHCLEGSELVTINHQPVNVESIRHDGADHALVVTDYANKVWAKVSIAHEQGQPVRMYGNPEGRQDLFRRGYVAGWDERVIYLDLPVGHGDSGAGVFDDQGRLVGVIMGYGSRQAFHMGVMQHMSPGFVP